MMGYVSGVSYVRTAQGAPLKNTDTTGMIAWLKKHCDEHPLETFQEGVMMLAIEMGGGAGSLKP